ncbi:folylpolyglutamate synthase/dihydrofolate synthase family protein [Nocardioides sp. NPDC127514]|uniref:bifunctional folylpolyglutamate synthase/dihydrofolate synthase n=1 Tax=unclassified Nocardioides TaxID=2615069 RepID=UPI00332B978B
MSKFQYEGVNRDRASTTVAGLADAEQVLLGRWPRHRPEPSLDRIRALTDLLGRPQTAYPVLHLTGTNGKTSTARMIDSLLRAHGWRTGRFTSPHLESITERVSLLGAPIPGDQFVQTFTKVEAAAGSVDSRSARAVSFFEAMAAIGFLAFAEADLDVAIVEVGMGGRWDATNVADGEVAVITPISLDHTSYLGSDVRTIATEKAGIIKPDATVICARQPDTVNAVIERRAAEVGATILHEGRDFAVASRSPGSSGQRLTLDGLTGREVVDVPLVGPHQAQNAAVALVAAQAIARNRGGTRLDRLAEGFAKATSPGRLELLRSRPPVYLDAAHNPAGFSALDAAARELGWHDVTVVLGVMSDKDVLGVLHGLSRPWVARVVCTQAAGERALPADELAATARDLLSVRVDAEPDLGTAVNSVLDARALVTGSVAMIGEVRALFQQ